MSPADAVDCYTAYAVTWRDEAGCTTEIFRSRAEADTQAENVRSWGPEVAVRKVDVGSAVLDEMENIRTRYGFTTADEWVEDGHEPAWPVWVVQHTTADGLDWEEPKSSREEADAFAAAVVAQGETVKGLFLFDAFDAIDDEIMKRR